MIALLMDLRTKMGQAWSGLEFGEILVNPKDFAHLCTKNSAPSVCPELFAADPGHGRRTVVP